VSRLGSNATLNQLLGLGLGLALACGPGAELPGDDAEASSSGDQATNTTGTSASDGAEVTTALDTSGEPPSTYEDDDGGTGCTFTCPDPPPPPPLPTGGGGPVFECDLVAQDCPEGEKCMPWANDGGDLWNATRCSPIAESPGALHEGCAVEGSGTSGIDDCGLSFVCAGVDPRTNVGTCSALCSWGGDEFLCDDPDEACAVINGVVPLCVHGCDPLAPDCGSGQGCHLMGDAFVCENVPGEVIGSGEPCSEVNTCQADLICAYNPEFDCGEEPGQGCCAAFCDVSVPDSCVEAGALCIPWIPVALPPRWVDLGVCVPPS